MDERDAATQDLLSRLRRIEGQVRGLQRMVERGAPCVETLTQIAAVTSAVQRVGSRLLRTHVRESVRQAVEAPSVAAERVESVVAAVDRFLAT